MKKATMIAIAQYLSENVQYANDAEKEFLEGALAELNADINRSAEQKAAKAAEYDAAKNTILGALTETPATIAEIYEAVKNELPQGFTRNKVQYAITRLWMNEVNKTEGKPNTYAIKA